MLRPPGYSASEDAPIGHLVSVAGLVGTAAKAASPNLRAWEDVRSDIVSRSLGASTAASTTHVSLSTAGVHLLWWLT
jgi:hypothetical protein